MPALNVEFTSEELEAVRADAARAGKTIKAYVHDLAVRERARKVFVGAAASYWNGHVEEFDAAFPDEAPSTDTAGRAA